MEKRKGVTFCANLDLKLSIRQKKENQSKNVCPEFYVVWCVCVCVCACVLYVLYMWCVVCECACVSVVYFKQFDSHQHLEAPYEVLEKYQGKELEGTKYVPLFNYFEAEVLSRARFRTSSTWKLCCLVCALF